MAIFSLQAMRAFYAAILPSAAPHPNKGKLVPLTQGMYAVAGYAGRFKAGDIVFVRTGEPTSSMDREGIYAVAKVAEWSSRHGFEIFWKLRMIGGYGEPHIDLYYQHPFGENPGAYSENWFADYGHGPLPKLNYYTDRVVRGGKTIWDVRDRLAEIEQG